MTRSPLDPVSTSSVRFRARAAVNRHVHGRLGAFLDAQRNDVASPDMVVSSATSKAALAAALRLCGRQRSRHIQRIQAGEQAVCPAGQIRGGGGIEAGDCESVSDVKDGLDDRVEKVLEVGLRGSRGDRRAGRHRCCGGKRTDGPTHDGHPTPAHLYRWRCVTGCSP